MHHTPLKIVGIGGSHSNFSASLYALRIALNAAQTGGALVQVFDVDTLNLPMYDTRRKEADIPVRAKQFAQQVHEADGIILASPLYHGTVSGGFKNTIDWLELLSAYEPKYLTNKAVGLIATAGGSQGLQAINTMEFIVRALRGFTVPLTVPIAQAWNVFDADGRLKNDALQQQLVNLGNEVLLSAKALRTRNLS